MLSIAMWFSGRVQALREHSERGAAAVEYGLLVALIAVVIVTAVGLVGTRLNETFCHVVANLPVIGSTTTC